MNRFWKETRPAVASSAWIDLSEEGVVNAVGELPLRRTDTVTPYGFYSVPPEGVETVFLPITAERRLRIGVVADDRKLQAGELELRAASGAYIRLKQDGTVEINGLLIRKDGSVKGD